MTEMPGDIARELRRICSSLPEVTEHDGGDRGVGRGPGRADRIEPDCDEIGPSSLAELAGVVPPESPVAVDARHREEVGRPMGSPATRGESLVELTEEAPGSLDPLVSNPYGQRSCPRVRDCARQIRRGEIGAQIGRAQAERHADDRGGEGSELMMFAFRRGEHDVRRVRVGLRRE